MFKSILLILLFSCCNTTQILYMDPVVDCWPQAHFIPLKKLVYEFEIISNLLTAPCAMLKCIVVLISPYGWYFDSHHKWIYHLSSFIILPAWINLMLIIGRFPRLGCYSLMFTTVMRNFLKVRKCMHSESFI